MEKKILDLLKGEADKMEAQLVIQEIMIDVVNRTPVPGAQADYVAEQKRFLESQYEMSKMTLENLKNLIKREDEKNG